MKLTAYLWYEKQRKLATKCFEEKGLEPYPYSIFFLISDRCIENKNGEEHLSYYI